MRVTNERVWTCFIGVATPDFDPNTVAVLRGRLVRYLMRSKEVTLGRNARGYQVDIDLSLEGKEPYHSGIF